MLQTSLLHFGWIEYRFREGSKGCVDALELSCHLSLLKIVVVKEFSARVLDVRNALLVLSEVSLELLGNVGAGLLEAVSQPMHLLLNLRDHRVLHRVHCEINIGLCFFDFFAYDLA